MPERRGLPARALRFAGLILHLFAGLLAVALVFPWVGERRALAIKQSWSRRLLTILGIALEVRGSPTGGSLLVANHLSWVDIFVINAARPTTFVAKAEVRAWPLLGLLAARGGTLFIERGRHRHAQHIAHSMAELLGRDASVAVFPEGVIGDGSAVLPFHAALLQPAISTGRPVQPLALAYSNADGSPATAPLYAGDTSFLQCLRAILATRGLRAILTCLPPVDSRQRNRRELAGELHARIGSALAAPRA